MKQIVGNSGGFQDSTSLISWQIKIDAHSDIIEPSDDRRVEDVAELGPVHQIQEIVAELLPIISDWFLE